jgi:predicted ATPase with chaperone activity
MVGLPDTVLREMRDRFRSAIANLARPGDSLSITIGLVG